MFLTTYKKHIILCRGSFLKKDNNNDMYINSRDFKFGLPKCGTLSHLLYSFDLKENSYFPPFKERHGRGEYHPSFHLSIFPHSVCSNSQKKSQFYEF